jgi:hypothetical protein
MRLGGKMNKGLNIKTIEHLKKCVENREKIKGVRIGDYVWRKNGMLERFCVQLSETEFQTNENGSFALSGSGNCSYSGACGDIIKIENIKESYPNYQDYCGAKGYGGNFWIYYNGILQGNCAVYVTIECRIFREI